MTSSATPGELLALADELRDLHSCAERGLELDRDMTFTVHGSGPGSSTAFSIDYRIFWRAQKALRRLAAKPADEGVRDRIIQTCANIANRYRPNLTARDIEQQIRALSTGAPKQ
jgi:hypothetical protein